MSFQSYLTYFLQCDTKEDILKNVSTAFVHTMQVIGIQNYTGQHWPSLYGQENTEALNKTFYYYYLSLISYFDSYQP